MQGEVINCKQFLVDQAMKTSEETLPKDKMNHRVHTQTDCERVSQCHSFE